VDYGNHRSFLDLLEPDELDVTPREDSIVYGFLMYLQLNLSIVNLPR
jgi:hypothetical protein